MSVGKTQSGAGGEKKSSWTVPEIFSPGSGEIQSDNSTANSVTVWLGARQRTKHIDTRYFQIQERVEDGILSIKKVLTRSQSLLQCYNNIASLQDCYSTDRGSHTPPQDGG